MKILSSSQKSDGNRAAQYFITILIVLLIGYLISRLPIMSHLEIARRISAAGIVIFFTKLAGLVLFYLFATRAISALPKQGGGFCFIRAIMVPGTLLVIVIIGQAILWQVLAPFMGMAGKKIYLSIAIALIILVGIWFAWVSYQNSPHLIDSTQRVKKLIPELTTLHASACPECGQMSSRSAKFCGHCGHPKHRDLKCAKCGAGMSSDQKFCQHCGQPAEALQISAPAEEA